MRTFIIEVVTLGLTRDSKISQVGFTTLEDAQSWCMSRAEVYERDGNYCFRSPECEYRIHEVSIN